MNKEKQKTISSFFPIMKINGRFINDKILFLIILNIKFLKLHKI